MRFFITGGTGSIGNQLIDDLLKAYPTSEIVSFSNNEEKIYEARSSRQDPRVSHVLGNVSNLFSVLDASVGSDVVLHLAAIKHIDIAEENPLETILVNILGTYNVIQAVKTNNISRMLFVSTDKSTSSQSVYGLSKLISEKMTLKSSTEKNKMSVVRFGNIINSSGSVFPKWKKQRDLGKKITVTSLDSTRFFIPVTAATSLILKILESFEGEEIFIPKMKSFKIQDLALFFAKDSDHIEILGLRAGENKHESSISSNEQGSLEEKEDYFIIRKGSFSLPEISSNDQGYLSSLKNIEKFL
jgi:FlaA1/EpsC-like NDP-sugar epimerase